MADTKISALTAASAAAEANEFAINEAGTSKKVTGTQLKTFTSNSPTLVTPALGTPASGVMTNVTGLPAAAILAGSFGAGAYVISTSLQAATVELGHASDTTLARASAGDLNVEGNIVYRAGGTDVPVADGGTGAGTAAGARTNLGLGTFAVENIAAVPAITLAGTVSGGGQQINNVIIGAATPLAGTFTAGTFTGDVVINAAGTAATGRVAIGRTSSAEIGLFIQGVFLSGAASQYGLFIDTTTSSVATTDSVAGFFRTRTAAVAFTATNAIAIQIADATKGAGSTITNQYGVHVAALTTGGANYAFYSAGAGDVVINAAGTVAAGRVAIGTTVSTTRAFNSIYTYSDISGDATGIFSRVNADVTTANSAAAQMFSISAKPFVAATNNKNWTVTIGVAGLYTQISTVAAGTGTITGAAGVWIDTPSIVGAAITNFYGVYVTALSGAGTNYAFYSAGAGLVRILDTTPSTSTTTGALVLGGAGAGLGVAGAAFIGTNLSVAERTGLYGGVSDRGGVTIGGVGGATFTGAAASYETAGVHIRYAGLTAPAGSTGDIANLYLAASTHTVTDGTHAVGADIELAGGTAKAGSGTITEGATLCIVGAYAGATSNYAILATGLVKFVTALQIAGTNIVTANQFSTATQGSASTPMYIGNGAITVTSDVRVKSHIEEWGGDALGLMRRINVVEYDMDDAHKPFGGVYDGKYVGLTAQNLYDVAPWTVNTQGGKDCWECRAGLKCEAHIPWQVKQDLLAGVYVRSFQQIDQRIHDLERELAALKGER